MSNKQKPWEFYDSEKRVLRGIVVATPEEIQRASVRINYKDGTYTKDLKEREFQN